MDLACSGWIILPATGSDTGGGGEFFSVDGVAWLYAVEIYHLSVFAERHLRSSRYAKPSLQCQNKHNALAANDNATSRNNKDVLRLLNHLNH